MPLQFNLLGSLSIESDEVPSELLKSPKGCALIVYLIVTQQTHTREFLADLLWEAGSTGQALRNLRALLNRIRELVLELQITRTSLAFQLLPNTSVDFLRLQAALEGEPAQTGDSELDTALRLYRGDLLANFYLEGASRFEEWLILERERLRQKVLGAYERLCGIYLEAQQWGSGLALAGRWLGLDPLNEEAVRACMQILAARGEPGTGLQQYELLRQQLWGQFELDPEPAMASLAARYYEEALDFARKIKNHNGVNVFMSNLCGARIGMGQFEKAAIDLEELITGTHHDWFGLSEACRFLSEAYLGLGKIAQALEMAQAALSLANPLNLVENGRTWRVLGLVMIEAGASDLSNLEAGPL